MSDSEFLKQLQCPLTGSPLQLAEQALVNRINAAIAENRLSTRGGESVTVPVEGGLVNSQREWFYPTWNRIPALLADEAIELQQLPDSSDAS